MLAHLKVFFQNESFFEMPTAFIGNWARHEVLCVTVKRIVNVAITKQALGL